MKTANFLQALSLISGIAALIMVASLVVTKQQSDIEGYVVLALIASIVVLTAFSLAIKKAKWWI